MRHRFHHHRHGGATRIRIGGPCGCVMAFAIIGFVVCILAFVFFVVLSRGTIRHTSIDRGPIAAG